MISGVTSYFVCSIFCDKENDIKTRSIKSFFEDNVNFVLFEGTYFNNEKNNPPIDFSTGAFMKIESDYEADIYRSGKAIQEEIAKVKCE